MDCYRWRRGTWAATRPRGSSPRPSRTRASSMRAWNGETGEKSVQAILVTLFEWTPWESFQIHNVTKESLLKMCPNKYFYKVRYMCLPVYRWFLDYFGTAGTAPGWRLLLGTVLFGLRMLGVHLVGFLGLFGLLMLGLHLEKFGFLSFGHPTLGLFCRKFVFFFFLPFFVPLFLFAVVPPPS